MATQEVTWCQRKKRNMREWSKIRAASQPRKVNQKRTLVSVCIQDSEMASRLVRQIPPPTVETYINQEKIRVTPPVRRCVKPFLHPSEQNSFQAMVFAQAMLPSPFRLWTCAERYLETKRHQTPRRMRVVVCTRFSYVSSCPSLLLVLQRLTVDATVLSFLDKLVSDKPCPRRRRSVAAVGRRFASVL
jgi:hypothetical protein